MLTFKNKEISYDYSKCQQCGTCEAVCPKKAITLKRIDNGLCNVYIDKERCIVCRKCERVCPAAKDTVTNKDYVASLAEKRYFFGYNENREIRRSSSSGGVCRTLIIESLKSGLVDGVYSLRKCKDYPHAEGCYYTQDNIPKYDDLPNSVYHSVMIGRNIGEVRSCGTLMIVGTSCQMRSLEIALKGKYKRLIKVCIFCKQQKSFDSTKFLAKAMGAEVPKNKNISTQYRGDGWPGTVRMGKQSLSWNMAAMLPFGRRLWSVPGCDICGDPFGYEVEADISLMDPWEICKENDLGETVITVFNNDIVSLLQSIPNMVLEEKTYQEIKPALGLGDVWRKREMVPWFRGEKCGNLINKAAKAELFQRCYLRKIVESLPRMPIFFYQILAHAPELRNKILKMPSIPRKSKKDIKVITRHTPSNYGSLLQTLATQTIIRRLGYDCNIIDYVRRDERGYKGVITSLNMKEAWKSNPLKRFIYIAFRYPTEKIAEIKFDKMRKQYLTLTPTMYEGEELSNVKADVYVTGSDQVWGPMMNGLYDTAYFLSFARGKKVSYAASFGKTEFTPETVESYKRLLSKYDYITVREDTAFKMLEDWNISCKGQVLDPTLLLTRREWTQMLNVKTKKGEYILIYQIHNDPALNEYAKGLAKIKNLPIIRISVSLHQIRRGGKLVYLPNIVEFISYIMGSSFIVTDSFHGTAFAINLNKQFVEVLPKNKTRSRNMSILRLTGLGDRIITDYNDYTIVDKKIDYNIVNDILTKERMKSIDLLKELLN